MRQLKCNITIKEKRKNEYNKIDNNKNIQIFDDLRAIKSFCVHIYLVLNVVNYRIVQDEMRKSN